MVTKQRIYEDQLYVHFVTFSCYKRRKLLSHDRICKIVLGTLTTELNSFQATCIGFVLMPDHVHVLLRFQQIDQLSQFLQQWKQRSSHIAKEFIFEHFNKLAVVIPRSDPFWQRKFYDFPIESREKLLEKLHYIHDNPVRAELAGQQSDWKWSSSRWYEQRRSVGIKITWID